MSERAYAKAQTQQKTLTVSSPNSSFLRHPSLVHDVLKSGAGQPLDTQTRAFMESRFGHDFSKVRIHTDERADESAQAVNALAYTVGQHIVFAAGQYAPEARAGKGLLAHELSHVVQQQHTSAALQGKLSIGSPSDCAELAADAAVHAVMRTENRPSRSLALQIQHHLHRSSPPSPTLQRAVITWGGAFSADTYRLTANPGMDGVEMKLRFKPNEHVDAKRIGLVQTSSSMHQEGPVPAGAFRKIDADEPGSEKFDETFESHRIPSEQVGPRRRLLAGTMIDQRPSQPNPLFATVDRGETQSSLAVTRMHTAFGEPGFYYRENGVLKEADALLNDSPELPSRFKSGNPIKETSQVFETTALAVDGVQTGTYYGSVLWGWRKDATGTVKQLPLSLGSEGRHSGMFARASEVWNSSTTLTGSKTLPLPMVSIQYTNARSVFVADPSKPKETVIAALEENTRLQVLDIGNDKPFGEWSKVTVLDTIHKGKVGWVRQTELSMKPNI